MNRLGISIVATKSYQHFLSSQARELQANLLYADVNFEDVDLIFVSEKGGKPACWNLYEELMPGIHRHHIEMDIKNNKKDYKENSNHTVAALRNTAFCKAKSLRCRALLSMDSDVILTSSNSLSCALHMLEFDKGYYGVVSIPYVSNGSINSMFLLGTGNEQNYIFPDIYDDERIVPKRYLDAKEAWDKAFIENPKERAKLRKKLDWVTKRIKTYPPKGNIFFLNSLNYRRRGWQPSDFPTAGKGDVTKTSWCGLGATLIGTKALYHSSWAGYHQKSTDDLYCIYTNWSVNGIRIASLPHCPASHGIIDPKTGKLILLYAYHESDKNKHYEGHLRTRAVDFYAFESGESFNPDGIIDESRIRR